LYGIDIAIAALPELLKLYPAARLSIAGTGPEQRALQQQATQLGLGSAVRFTGPLTPAGMAQLYSEADLLLNPTHADNMPNSLLEAMACGLPVITTNVGGIPHMVTHGQTAWFMGAHSADALVSAVSRVWNDVELRTALAVNGLALARVNSRQMVLASWQESYQAMLTYGDNVARPGLRT
jgi:glycosyltransferase involved in cell wall biosynthesis